MKYFEKCLKKISENDEIDISIHCDASIFEWLLNYIFSQEENEKLNIQNGLFSTVGNNWQLKVQKCETSEANINPEAGGPKLDIKNVVSILISADFLKIEKLVKECMEFFVANIDEIAKV
jgi:hypothetical protein